MKMLCPAALKKWSRLMMGMSCFRWGFKGTGWRPKVMRPLSFHSDDRATLVFVDALFNLAILAVRSA
jgi:hypothetical protein